MKLTIYSFNHLHFKRTKYINSASAWERSSFLVVLTVRQLFHIDNSPVDEGTSYSRIRFLRSNFLACLRRESDIAIRSPVLALDQPRLDSRSVTYYIIPSGFLSLHKSWFLHLQNVIKMVHTSREHYEDEMRKWMLKCWTQFLAHSTHLTPGCCHFYH